MEILHKNFREKKINQKLKNLVENFVDSNALSTENSHKKNKNRKKERDNLYIDTSNIKGTVNGDSSIEFLSDSDLKIKKEKVKIDKSDELNKQDIINVHTKKKKKKCIVDEVSNFSFDKNYYNNIDNLDNKIKTELVIIDLEPDNKFKPHILDNEPKMKKKKKKKKHKDYESSISSIDKSYYNNLNIMDIKKKKIKIEYTDVIKHEKEDDVNSYDIDILYDNNIKKKKKKNDYIEELDQCSIKNNEKITKKIKIEPRDFNDKESQLEKNFPSFDVNNSGDDGLNKKNKKKKKPKHLDIKDNSSDVLVQLKSEDKIVKNKVSNPYTNEKNVNMKNKLDNCLSTKLHSKKARVKVEYETSNSDNIDYYLSNANVKSSKKKKKESNVEMSIDNIENSNKNKIMKHKRIENNKIEGDVRELDEENETKNHIEESNNIELTSEKKSKKKKHKKRTRESIQLDVVQGINTKNTELVEPPRKKMKKKNDSEKLPEESLNELRHLDLNFVSNYENQDKENISENYKKKKKKKHKHKENEIKVKDQIINNLSNKLSIKKKNSRQVKSVTAVEGKFSDDNNDDKVSSSKNSKIIKDKSSDDNSDYNKSKSKKIKNEEKMKNKIFNDNSDWKKNESSDLESEEGDYSESEINPRIHKSQSIYAKCPKVARMMKETDDDDNDLPHLQHRKLTLSEAMQLANMKIEVRHEIPPQHQVEKYSGTHTLTAKEKAEFEKYIPMKKGRFNSEEDRKIVHNWKKFCKRHNWNRSIIFPFLHQKRTGFFFATPVEERKKFVQILAKGLPNRTLYSVYFRFRNLYATHKKNRYSKAEDEMILSEHKDLQGRNRFWAIARKLNRTRASVWRRYKLLIKKTKGSDSEAETNI